MIPISLLLGASFLALFLWANNNGQFDDLEGPAHSILYEDETAQGTDEEAIDSDKKVE